LIIFAPMEKPDRKSEILTVSARLFRDRGYSAVSMRDIAQALDIKAASLYNHIKSKQEILVLIVLRIAEEFTAGMKHILEDEEDAMRQLERLIDLHIDLTLREPAVIACLNNDWMHLTDADLKYFLKMRDEYESGFRAILKKGIDAEEIASVNIDVIMFSLLSTLRTLYLWYGRKKLLPAEELKVELKRVLLGGIVPSN
jgi:TetR/AcrR family transcriptional regulator, cholesterol catabolism regulator